MAEGKYNNAFKSNDEGTTNEADDLMPLSRISINNLASTVERLASDPDLQNLIDFSQQFVSTTFRAVDWAKLYGFFSWNVVEEQTGHRIGKIMFISIVRQKLLSMK